MKRVSIDQKDVKDKSSPFGSWVGYLAIKLGEFVTRRLEAALLPLGLTPREYNVMTCISLRAETSQQDLSRTLGLYAPGVVGLVDALQSRELTQRSRSTTDRRRYVLTLSAKGKRLLKRADFVVSTLEDELFSCISAQERALLDKLIRRTLEPSNEQFP